MNLVEKILRATATTATRALMPDPTPEPPRETIVFKSKGSPFGTHERFGVLNRKTRRMLRSKRFAKKLKAGLV